MTTLRKGDVVTVSGVISGDAFDNNSGGRSIKVSVKPYHDIYVPVSEVKVVQPEFRVGDRVEWKSAGDYYRGEVLAISGEHLWIDRGEGNYATVWTGLASRLDPEPEPATEDPAPIPDLEPRVPRFEDGEDRSGEVE